MCDRGKGVLVGVQSIGVDRMVMGKGHGSLAGAWLLSTARKCPLARLFVTYKTLRGNGEGSRFKEKGSRGDGRCELIRVILG